MFSSDFFTNDLINSKHNYTPYYTIACSERFFFGANLKH